MAIALAFEKRDEKITMNVIRKAGKMPAVFYGRKQASTPITLSGKEFVKVWKKAGENTVVTLSSGGTELEALIHEVDRHPVTGMFRHADFYVFEKGQKLKIKIPLEFVGVSPAVKDLGAVLVKVLHDLEIEAAPKDLPQKIAVDISGLTAFGSVVLAKNIVLPAGVALVTLPDEVAASVYEPKEEVVEEAPVDLSAIEVVKKGKEVKEGEEGEADSTGGAQAGGAKATTPAEKKAEKK